MAKSVKGKGNQGSSSAITKPLKPIEIDEVIVVGQTTRPKNELDGFMRNLILEKFLEHLGDEMKFLTVEGWDEESFEETIQKILGTDNLEVNIKNLKTYRAYLKKQLKLPCNLTGSEDVDWENYDINSKNSKKKPLSERDIFKLIQIIDEIDLEVGLLVEVERISDRSKYILPLADLEETDEDSPNDDLLDDYSIWFFNYLED